MSVELRPYQAEASLGPEDERAEVLERFDKHPFANLETYEYFSQSGPEAQAAKSDFIDAAMAGETPEAPRFAYPLLGIDTLTARREELTELLDDVLRLDINDEANRLLREKVTDRIHEVGIMLLAKIQSDMQPDDVMYKAVSYQLGENMREVYGSPASDIEHWRGILGYRLSLLRKVEDQLDVPVEVQAAWGYVRDALPQDLPITKPYKPKPETEEWYSRELDKRLAPARAAVRAALDAGDITLDEASKLDCDNALRAARLALDACGYSNWDVQPTDRTSVSVSQTHEQLLIPKVRYMSLQEFDKRILAHEIDMHVARRVNGDRCSEPILRGTGLMGNAAWEEGASKAQEALVTGKVTNEESAFNYYLSLGLSEGLDGNGARNFGQTFDLVWRMRIVSLYLKGKLDESGSGMRRVVERAYDSVERIFHGTDGRVPGVVFPKDGMTYYLGQTDVWRKWDSDMELPEDERRRELALERSAKIDPVRPDHRRVAQQAQAQTN